jgi:hypothetical protein
MAIVYSVQIRQSLVHGRDEARRLAIGVAEERYNMLTHLVALSWQQLVSEPVSWNRVDGIDVGVEWKGDME